MNRRFEKLTREESEARFGRHFTLMTIGTKGGECFCCDHLATGRSAAKAGLGVVVDCPTCDDCHAACDGGTFEHMNALVAVGNRKEAA